MSHSQEEATYKKQVFIALSGATESILIILGDRRSQESIRIPKTPFAIAKLESS